MDPAVFYGPTHRGNGYGPEHSGSDFNGWAAGTQIPSFIAGRVMAKGYHILYGNWVALATAHGAITWSHLKSGSPLEVRDLVDYSDPIGALGNTGLYSRGAHAHVSWGQVPEPWKRPTKDPLPLIIEQIKAANSGTTPAPEPEPETDTDMLDGYMYQIVNPAGGMNGSYVRFGSRVSFPLTAARALITAGIINHGIPDTVPDQKVVDVPGGGKATVIQISQDNAATIAMELYGISADTFGALSVNPDPQKRIYPPTAPTAVGGGDNAPVLEAIAALPASVLHRFREFWASGK